MILVLVSGLLTLFLLLAAAFAQLTEFTEAGTGADRARRAAQLTAESGMEYAAARLWEEPRSGAEIWPILDAVNARDDWSARGSEPPGLDPSRLQNPSFSHGEPWKDTLGADGAFDNDLFFDADGNGSFDARSGRLRGGPQGEQTPFFLTIRASEGKVCVNSGIVDSPLGDWNLDGILDADDPRPSTDTNGNGIPDWRDPDHIENRHLVNLLDNLGAILGVSTRRKTPFWPADPSPAQGPGEMGFLDTSDLGRQVATSRPRGGYASIADLAPILGKDYPLAAPFLSVAGRIAPMASRYDSSNGHNITLPPLANPPAGYEFQFLIDFNRAPTEVIAASLRWISASGNWNPITFSWENPDNCITPFIRLGDAEADRVAERLANARPVPTWRAFLETLHSVSGAFEDDPFTVGINEKTDPLWKLLKEDLILAQAMPKNYRHDPFTLRMNGLEVERETVQEGPDRACQRRISPFCLQQPLLHAAPFNALGQVEFTKPQAGGLVEGIPCRETAGCFLDWGAGTGTFDIDASGRVSGGVGARARGTLATFPGEIRLAGQQDFEQAPPSLTGLGAVPWRYPGGDHEALGPCLEKTGIDTYPKFPIDSFTLAGMSIAEKAHYAYSRADGGLRLKAAQTEDIDSPACTFAVPFNQDPGTIPADRWYTHMSNADDDWQDQIGDPVGTPAQHRSPDPIAFGINNKGESFLNRGYFTGPEGPRYRVDPKNSSGIITSGVLMYKWLGNTAPPFPGGPVKISDATIACWYPAAGEPPLWPLSPGNPAARCLQGQFCISREGMTALYLEVVFEGNAVLLSDTSDTHVIVPWWVADPVAGAAPWHHLAISFNADGTRAKVFCDGREELDVPIDSTSGNDDTTLNLSFPLDDFRILVPGIRTEAEATALAQEDRYARTGTYHSPRFRFDAARLPRGASVRGISWNAFIPERTQGKIRLAVEGFDDGGQSVGSGQAPWWNGSGATGHAIRLPPAREIDCTIEIDAADPEDLPGLGDVLRDTPHVSSVTIRYGTGPRWSSYR